MTELCWTNRDLLALREKLESAVIKTAPLPLSLRPTRSLIQSVIEHTKHEITRPSHFGLFFNDTTKKCLSLQNSIQTGDCQQRSTETVTSLLSLCKHYRLLLKTNTGFSLRPQTPKHGQRARQWVELRLKAPPLCCDLYFRASVHTVGYKARQEVFSPAALFCPCGLSLSLSLHLSAPWVCFHLCLHLSSWNLFLFLLRPDIIFKIPSGFLFLSPRHTFQFPLQFYFLADGFRLKLRSRFEVHRSRLNSSSSSSAGFWTMRSEST